MSGPGPLPPAGPPGAEPPLRPEHLGQRVAPELIAGAPLRDPASPALSSNVHYVPDSDTGEPIVDLSRWVMKQSMTKKSRTDLSRAMVAMCSLTGWRDTTLNPDMGDDAKMAILAARFGKVTTQDADDTLYNELIDMAAVTMGWAQGIARRDARDRKRKSRAKKKEKKREKREKKKEKKDRKRAREDLEQKAEEAKKLG